MIKNVKILVLFAVVMLATTGYGAERPRLVVNFVVGGLRCEEFDKCSSSFLSDGFRRFMEKGVVCSNSYYEFMQTNSAATLATMTTGAAPSMHGVVGDKWVDYTTGTVVGLIADDTAESYGTDLGSSKVSNKNLVVPTLGDEVLDATEREGKVVTVAADVTSAIVMGGMKSRSVFWLDAARGKWTTSNKYAGGLPMWVTDYNDADPEKSYLGQEWVPVFIPETYKSKEATVINMDAAGKRVKSRRPTYRDYAKLQITPAGNYMVADFVKQVMVQEELGLDDNVDVLNVCFDASRFVSEMYGPESLEAEDMLYRMDLILSELMNYIETRVGGAKDVLFVLTSDHGMSDSYDFGVEDPRPRFNVAQFRVLLNGFMAAHYGGENWILEYSDRNIYLNRQQAYSMGLDVATVQRQAATFVLQFRGISHVLTSDDLMGGSFATSYGKLMQNGFYPKRSGDLMINLMPDWIEDEDEVRADSGSLYDYDRHVPLMFVGCDLEPMQIKEKVDMAQLPVTLAYIMGVERPAAAEVDEIEYFKELYK